MSNGKKGILILLILVAVLAAGLLGYRALGARYRASAANQDPPTAAEQEPEAEEPDAEEPEPEEPEAEEPEAEEPKTEEPEVEEPKTEEPEAEEPETEEPEAEESESEFPDAPDFRMLNWDGEETSLSDFRGKPTVINFWASWCPPCKNELPFFEEAFREYGERVNFIMLNLTDGRKETIELAESYINGQSFTFPLYFDVAAEGAYAYGTFSIPVTAVVTADGKLYQHRVGGIPTREILDEMFTPLL